MEKFKSIIEKIEVGNLPNLSDRTLTRSQVEKIKFALQIRTQGFTRLAEHEAKEYISHAISRLEKTNEIDPKFSCKQEYLNADIHIVKSNSENLFKRIYRRFIDSNFGGFITDLFEILPIVGIILVIFFGVIFYTIGSCAIDYIKH